HQVDRQLQALAVGDFRPLDLTRAKLVVQEEQPMLSPYVDAINLAGQYDLRCGAILQRHGYGGSIQRLRMAREGDLGVQVPQTDQCGEVAEVAHDAMDLFLQQLRLYFAKATSQQASRLQSFQWLLLAFTDQLLELFVRHGCEIDRLCSHTIKYFLQDSVGKVAEVHGVGLGFLLDVRSHDGAHEKLEGTGGKCFQGRRAGRPCTAEQLPRHFVAEAGFVPSRGTADHAVELCLVARVEEGIRVLLKLSRWERWVVFAQSAPVRADDRCGFAGPQCPFLNGNTS